MTEICFSPISNNRNQSMLMIYSFLQCILVEIYDISSKTHTFFPERVKRHNENVFFAAFSRLKGCSSIACISFLLDISFDGLIIFSYEAQFKGDSNYITGLSGDDQDFRRGHIGRTRATEGEHGPQRENTVKSD